jgi:ketosteroid isomerase-like protein
MSANMDLVRSIFACWERGDFSSVEWADPEIEYVSAEPLLPPGHNGVEEMAKVWRNWLHAWEDFHADADRYRQVDAERVLVLLHYGGRGKPSGLEVPPTDGASLFHIRDGKVTRLVLYLDRERAFAELGLAPEAG